MAKRGLREERETIIRFDETDEPVIIYTFNADLKRRLKDFARKYPDLCRKTVEDKEYGGTYECNAPYNRSTLHKDRKLHALQGKRHNLLPHCGHPLLTPPGPDQGAAGGRRAGLLIKVGNPEN